MSILFTADTHFGHANIIKYCKRPFTSADEMDEALVAAWNDKVKPEDTVYHLGDVTFKKLEMVSRLNGTKILIRGNHDRGFTSTKLNLAGFSAVFCKPEVFEIEGTRILMMHAPQQVEGATASITLCGHVHDSWKHKDGYINVGVDVWNWSPVTLEEILRG